MLQYVDNLLLCNSSQVSSQENSIHLLKLLAFKGHKVTMEKLQFAQTQVQYLEYPISKQGRIWIQTGFMVSYVSQIPELRVNWKVFLD